MSGAWAQACDQYIAQDDDGMALVVAAGCITQALWVTDPDDKKAFVEQAGAYLRAYRMSLPYQDRRGRDVGWYSGDQLLWAALGQISAIGRGKGSVTGLRLAEACLRTWWKAQKNEEER